MHREAKYDGEDELEDGRRAGEEGLEEEERRKRRKEKGSSRS